MKVNINVKGPNFMAQCRVAEPGTSCAVVNSLGALLCTATLAVWSSLCRDGRDSAPVWCSDNLVPKNQMEEKDGEKRLKIVSRIYLLLPIFVF